MRSADCRDHVEESRSSGFRLGEYVTGMFGWQDYAVVDAEDAEAIDRKVGGWLAYLDIASASWASMV